jgi:nucleotide-binding universal stress UspA family protein
MYDRILVPTDGSTGTAHVVMQALDLAEQYDATVHALNVVDTEVSSMLSDVGGDDERLREQGESAVGMVERMAESHDVDVVTAVESGDPAKTILAYAEEIDADVVVVGTHGRSGVKRYVLGSVAERLVRHATCPVLTVRLPESDVTVKTAEEAESVIAEALEADGYDAPVTGVERQRNVWVADASGEDGAFLVYLDPVTQRTSVIPQAR